MIKNILNNKTLLRFIGIAIVVLLVLKQCNQISNLKEDLQSTEKIADRNFNNYKAAQDSILIEKGAQSVALLRLTFFPFGLCSYILGVTSISPLKYMIGTSTYAVNAIMQVFIGSQLYHI